MPLSACTAHGAVIPLVWAAPVTTTPEEDQCNYDFYLEILDYELANGFLEAQIACESYLDKLQRLQFGPPTQWEIFNTVCKTACRTYYDRWQRVVSESNCDCTKFTYSSCPPSVTDLLCSVVGFCYDWQTYFYNYCEDLACGRQANNEDSWRHCKLTHVYTQ